MGHIYGAGAEITFVGIKCSCKAAICVISGDGVSRKRALHVQRSRVLQLGISRNKHRLAFLSRRFRHIGEWAPWTRRVAVGSLHLGRDSALMWVLHDRELKISTGILIFHHITCSIGLSNNLSAGFSLNRVQEPPFTSMYLSVNPARSNNIGVRHDLKPVPLM